MADTRRIATQHNIARSGDRENCRIRLSGGGKGIGYLSLPKMH
jgi:hypothetical protein